MISTLSKKEAISIIMPMRNASTTVDSALASIEKQEHPVREIFVFDNASSDNSVEIVLKYIKKSKMQVSLIRRKNNMGIGANFNEGVEKSKSSIVVLMHSDCSLPTKEELGKLVEPLIDDGAVVAAYPTIFLLESVWRNYEFWEKYFFARQAGTSIAGFTTKFDVVRRDVYLKLGGFDVENFGMGGEDSDLLNRLGRVGKVAKSSARVTHLHYLGEGYSIKKLLAKQKGYAKTFGRIIRMRGASLINNGLILLVKPGLAILPFLPGLHYFGVVLIILYSFLYTKKMFMTKDTLMDSRILIVPFLNVFSLYYETFWIIESFLFGKNNVE